MTHVEVIRTLRQQDFDAFATLSGDFNAIHVDPAFAARTAFQRTVAHGAMLTAILRAVAGPLLQGRPIRTQAAMFPAPTFCDEPMRFSADRIDANTIRLTCARVKDGVVTCEVTVEVS